MQAIETPPAILIRRPAAPTVTDPRRFPAAALAVIAIMDEAMAGWRRSGQANCRPQEQDHDDPGAIRPGSS
jgi:hypothetical protein